MEGGITEAQIIEEIRAWSDGIPEREPGVLTGPEIAEAMGVSDKTARPKIKKWIRDGKIEVTSTVIMNMAQRKTRVPAYRIVSSV